MGFGKPRRTDVEKRCLLCGATFKDREAPLRHAGRTDEGDFWNQKCPECGAYDMMHSDYADLTDEEFIEKQHDLARNQQEHRQG